ncbi:hypothetical protein NQ095_06125 [Rossellomorea sp. SC111]|uniref:beta-ketoacyl synthase N-terminal-like domain-containing protein n=1 Tax=Rossellomorea sp. SC111 TaxID=2968985 RepID=UPI00215A70D6|nr:beta-ketoacyl synthase N-terminal-like domain-containing protein [Rossellomorea sp. SC111]MCR8847978.1 hypothetical protein [Rossellomorea sp. SC111]
MAGAVITGYGIIGPKFSSVSQFTEVLMDKKIVLDRFKVKGKSMYMGKVEDEDLTETCKRILPRGGRLPKAVQMVLYAAEEALLMSRFPVSDYRVGVVIGSSGGAISDTIKVSKGSTRSSVFSIGNMNSYSLVSSICAAFQVNGMSFSLANSCTSGLDAVQLGNLLIESNQVDMCIVGGSDSTLDDVIVDGFSRLKILFEGNVDKGPPGPFSTGEGFAISEGAGVLILERRNIAEERGARVRGEVGLSYVSQDGLSPYQSDPGGRMLLKAVDHCLSQGLPSYINSQALGILQQDRLEADIYKERFAVHSIPITSIKGMTGHPMGASGIFQLISAVISLEKQFIPPTIGYNKEYFSDLSVVEDAQPHSIERVLITSQGYGGINSCMMIAKGER